MGFSTPPGHVNPRYDPDTDSQAEELDEERLQETALAAAFVGVG